MGEALTLPEGLAEGRVDGVAVRVGGLGRRLLLEGRGVGSSFAGGGALVVAGGRETGDSLRGGLGGGVRIPSPLGFRTPFRAGCVGSRSGEADAAGAPVTRTSASAGGGSGTDAARGAVDW
ncbi:hypothetical protein FHS34_001289 [Streptomyces echinatus]|uniref:Uncharacterized protein n=1 Tax=Streptomyces echinatus TaxID=67293 RepID=A0A7W9PQ70_9ACTN|nr:hypothetical protein [Streptomyces echinatus]